MLVIHNANLHSLDRNHPLATALALEHGRVIAAGSDDEILSAFSPSPSLNAEGRTIIPGLTDAHIHIEEYALSQQKVDCETPTRQECLQRVAKRVEVTPPGEWVLGHGWNQNNWAEGYGTATLLDEIAPNNPVYLTHKSLHCGWANSLPCNWRVSAVIPPIRKDGRIGRLPNGDPDGILFESAMELIEMVIPEPTLEQVVRAIQHSIPRLWQMGLTGAHDFDHQRCFSALQVLHQQQELKFRVLKVPSFGRFIACC